MSALKLAGRYAAAGHHAASAALPRAIRGFRALSQRRYITDIAGVADEEVLSPDNTGDGAMAPIDKGKEVPLTTEQRVQLLEKICYHESAWLF